MKYYRKTVYLFLSIAFAISLQGCDWVKGQLGMPTYEDIARMKEEIRINEEQKAAMAQREQFVRDSLAKVQQPQIVEVNGYHVIVGSFKVHSNAEALVKKLREKGYGKAMQIPFKNGYMMVSLGEMERLQPAIMYMTEVMEDPVITCGDDIWVYSAKRKLHIEE